MTLADQGEYLTGYKKKPAVTVTKGVLPVAALSRYYIAAYGDVVKENMDNVEWPEKIMPATNMFKYEDGILHTNKFMDVKDDFQMQVRFACKLDSKVTSYCTPELQYYIESNKEDFLSNTQTALMQMPEELFDELCSENYFNNKECTPEMFLRSYLEIPFQALTRSKLGAKLTDDVAVILDQRNDKIWKIPVQVYERLSFDDMMEVHRVGDELLIGDISIYKFK